MKDDKPDSRRMRVARALFEADWPYDKSWYRRGEDDYSVVRYCLMADAAIDVINQECQSHDIVSIVDIV